MTTVASCLFHSPPLSRRMATYYRQNWQIDIMPYIEQDMIKVKWDPNLANNHGSNITLMAKPIPILKCPASPSAPAEDFNQANNTFYGNPAVPIYKAGVSDYFCSSNSQAFSPALPGIMPYLSPPTASSFKQVTDGLSDTILLVEMGGGPVRYLSRQRTAAMGTIPLSWQLGREQSSVASQVQRCGHCLGRWQLCRQLFQRRLEPLLLASFWFQCCLR